MHLIACLFAAIVPVGLCISLLAYRRAPVSAEIGCWDVAFVTGLSLVGSGGLGLTLTTIVG